MQMNRKTPRGRDMYETVRAIKYTHFGGNTIELPLKTFFHPHLTLNFSKFVQMH